MARPSRTLSMCLLGREPLAEPRLRLALLLEIDSAVPAWRPKRWGDEEPLGRRWPADRAAGAIVDWPGRYLLARSGKPAYTDWHAESPTPPRGTHSNVDVFAVPGLAEASEVVWLFRRLAVTIAADGVRYLPHR
jgi:hypothetical protein